MRRKLHGRVTMAMENPFCAAIVKNLYLWMKHRYVMSAAIAFIHITFKLTKTNGRAQKTAKHGAIGVEKKLSATSIPSNVSRAIPCYMNTAMLSTILPYRALLVGKCTVRLRLRFKGLKPVAL